MKTLSIKAEGIEALPLQLDHMDQIIELMNKEGWYYYDRTELKRYLKLGQDCFTLIKQGQVIGSIFTTSFKNQAWIGNIVVAQQFRGFGLAAQLIQAVMAFLKDNRQVNTFRLGSVPLAIGLYKKAGFHAEAFTTAQEAELPINQGLEDINLPDEVRVEKIGEADLNALAQLDEQFFHSNRLELLSDLYKDSIKESCLCLKDKNKIVGFLMIRRRQESKTEGQFAEGPDYAYRLGPLIVSPEYGINGLKALFQQAIQAVNEEVKHLSGTAKIYIVFPRNAKKEGIYQDTRALAEAMEMNAEMDLDQIFDEHQNIFSAKPSNKNQEQWDYMKNLGFHQEYFEQVMSCSDLNAYESQANPEGIFATATPGDKA